MCCRPLKLAAPTIDDSDLRAVSDVLRSGWLANGPQVVAFERELAAAVGAEHAVATSSGTAALELALRAAGVGPGDEVIVPAFTYPATAHAARLVGAEPVLVDVDAVSWNLDPSAAETALTTRTRAILPVDLFGYAADTAALGALRLADGARPAVVEDAACALGASRDGVPCGRGTPLACFSFHPRKIVTTGEGGMIVTDDAALAARLRQLRNHGRSADGDFVEAAGNHRMSELAAALGRSQLRRLAELVARRRTLAARYFERLAATPGVSIQGGVLEAGHAYQTLAICLPRRAPRTVVLGRLAERGIEAGIATYAVHQVRPYRREPPGGDAERLPVSERLGNRGLALPLHGGMAVADVDRVCDELLVILDDFAAQH